MTSALSPPSLPAIHRRTASRFTRLPTTPCVLICGLLMPLPGSLGAAPMPLKEISAAELAELGQVLPVTNGRAKVDGDTVEHTCVSRWKFTPAVKDGQPVASKLQVPIVFQRH